MATKGSHPTPVVDGLPSKLPDPAARVRARSLRTFAITLAAVVAIALAAHFLGQPAPLHTWAATAAPTVQAR